MGDPCSVLGLSKVVSEDRLNLEAPRWARDLPRRPGKLRTIQFSSLPPEPELEQFGEFIHRHPDIEVRAYGGYDGSIRDTEFLRHFPSARRVSVDALYDLGSFDGLRHLSQHLESLALGQTRRRQSVEALSRFKGLRILYLEGHHKGIEVLSELRDLRGLTLRSITLPELDILVPLGKLRSLDIKLGGIRDLSPLSEMKQIEYLELWMIRGLSDLSEVAGLTRLRYLFLHALRQVSGLPDLSQCEHLERIHLETMKGLTDLRPLRSAPVLKDLSMVDMPHLRWEHVQLLKDHPTLKRLLIGTGSAKRNRQFSEGLGYPRTGPPSPICCGSNAVRSISGAR